MSINFLKKDLIMCFYLVEEFKHLDKNLLKDLKDLKFPCLQRKKKLENSKKHALIDHSAFKIFDKIK